MRVVIWCLMMILNLERSELKSNKKEVAARFNDAGRGRSKDVSEDDNE